MMENDKNNKSSLPEARLMQQILKARHTDLEEEKKALQRAALCFGSGAVLLRQRLRQCIPDGQSAVHGRIYQL